MTVVRLTAENKLIDQYRSVIDPHDRHTWRSGVRSAVRAASQLPDVDVAPVPAR